MVHILLFASLAQQAGTQKVSLEIERSVSIEEIKKMLQNKVGELSGIEHAMVAINEEYAELSDTVKAGDTVAFIPPVSGG